MEVYAKRDEAGKFDEKTWTVDEAKRDEYTKAEEAFGDRIAEIDRPKLTAHDIRDIKPTADELGALEPIFDMESFEHMPEPVAGPMVGGKKLKQV